MSKKLTTEEFIEKARKVHGDKYDYSKVNYENCETKIHIICPIHGEFSQTPSNHLNKTRPRGCPKCGDILRSIAETDTKEFFIEKAKRVHGDKYDYSKVEYINSRTKVCIICPTHGKFWQTPSSHLRNHGCPKCKVDDIIKRQTMTNNIFIEKAKKIHGDKYDYSKVKYVNIHTKVCIICPIHGEFWQVPNYHLSGCGCPQCKKSHLENEVESFLKMNNILYESQKKFEWLGLQSLDFYLPKYGIAIECQGEQHYKSIKKFGGEITFNKIQIRDYNKKKLCMENGIKLLYYTSYKGVKENNINIFKNKKRLIEHIINL